MELSKYFQQFDEANKAHDHYKMMEIMQKFFNEIHSAHYTEILSFYSMAQQFELLGMNSKPIKDAVISRVKSEYSLYTMWRSTAVGLNALLVADNRSNEVIVLKN